MRYAARTLFVCFLLWGLQVAASQAQSGPRVGLGLNVQASTEQGVGPGVLLRMSAPINADVSLAIGSSFTGYVLEGQDEASYAFNPQVSAIVTVPIGNAVGTYVMGGVGAYVPFGETQAGGSPTFHLGLGRAWLLRDSSFFVEADPSLVIGETAVDLVLPLRLGIIF